MRRADPVNQAGSASYETPFVEFARIPAMDFSHVNILLNRLRFRCSEPPPLNEIVLEL